MGLEVSEEFRPITSIRTVSTARPSNFGIKFSEETKEVSNLDEEEDCGGYNTPKSPTYHTLKSPLVCPPAPKKPKPIKRKSGPPPQGFFDVPQDLASVFKVHATPCKKFRTT